MHGTPAARSGGHRINCPGPLEQNDTRAEAADETAESALRKMVSR